MSSGVFINFFLPFKKSGIFVPAHEQAKTILDTSRKLIRAGAKGVGITYSANYGQTRKIEETYQAGEWYTGTDGANQAAVMHQMEERMKQEPYQDLQGRVRIVPITTMTYQHSEEAWKKMHMGVVENDLAVVKTYLDGGWTILGWQNQDTVNDPVHPYAVGGGIATVPAEITKEIQNTLKQFALDYKSSGD